jgi:EmrB/QacA subfamily drug resistance transporter
MTSDVRSTPVQHRNVRLVFLALLLVMLLAALDQTIVAIAMPTIVGDLGGLSGLSQHYAWVIIAYLLPATVSAPLYGKFGDLFGRKGLLQMATVLFLVGSALCGLSQNLTELNAFRALQGLGAGGMMVITIAVIGDLIPPRERGRYQGYFGAVFGVATVSGPVIGALLLRVSWRWIFYVNLPVGIAALIVIGIAFHSRTAHVRHTIDYLGAGLLAAGLSAIVLFTSLGGTTYAWNSPEIVGMMIAGPVLIVLFLLVERRAAEPILPLGLFRDRIFSVSSAVGFIVGLSLFGAVTYLPLYLQNVKGQSILASGLQMTPMMVGVLFTSIGSGLLITRFGRYKPFPIAGLALTTLGLALLSRLAVSTPLWRLSLDMLIVGLGLGLVMQVLVIAVQNSVAYRNLGVATSGSTLFRQIGGLIGIAAFGAIFSNRFHSELVATVPAGSPIPRSATPQVLKALPPALRDAVVHAFTISLEPVFLIAAAIAALGFALAWFLREIPLRKTVVAVEAESSQASPGPEEGEPAEA